MFGGLKDWRRIHTRYERRKTGWMGAEAAGDPGPWRRQAILGRGHWDADVLRNIVRDYIVENLATDDAVLVIDETGFLKQGKAAEQNLGTDVGFFDDRMNVALIRQALRIRIDRERPEPRGGLLAGPFSLFRDRLSLCATES